MQQAKMCIYTRLEKQIDTKKAKLVAFHLIHIKANIWETEVNKEKRELSILDRTNTRTLGYHYTAL